MPTLEELVPPYAGYNYVGKVHHNIPAYLDPATQQLPSPFVVVITGGSRGIGAATALQFAKAGATGIIITARKVESLEATKKACQEAAKSPNLKISTLAAHAGPDEESARLIAETVKKEHGRLDLLINNAGGIGTEPSTFEHHFHKTNADQIQMIIDATLTARFMTMRHMIPLLLDTPDGAQAVIDVSSLGSHMTMGAPIGYSVAALADNRLIQSAGERYAELGLVFYAVHPGTVLTTLPPGFPEWLKEQSIDDPGLLGAVAIWLVKEKREWLSGRYISCNWDMEELEKRKDDIVQGDKLKFRMVL